MHVFVLLENNSERFLLEFIATESLYRLLHDKITRRARDDYAAVYDVSDGDDTFNDSDDNSNSNDISNDRDDDSSDNRANHINRKYKKAKNVIIKILKL